MQSQEEYFTIHGLATRLYKGEGDLLIMLDLSEKVRPTAHKKDYPTGIDIEENLSDPLIRENARLWFEGDQLVGWAYVDDGNNLLWELAPSHSTALGELVVAWGKACVRKNLAIGEIAALDASCDAQYHERLDFLKKHGFHKSKGFSIGMLRDLSVPIPAPDLPAGYSIRPARGIEEAEAIAAAHRTAFGTDYMTTENRQIIMSTSGYDPSLDMLVISPDGQVVGYCTCTAEADGYGYTDPVAVHPDHQHLGLAKALLLTGLRLLLLRGMTSAEFTTSGDNTAMLKAGESVGFQPKRTILWFEQTVGL